MDPKPSKYETIWNAEDPDQEEFLSETDVDVSNEKTWHAEQGRSKWKQPRGIVYKIKKLQWIINTSSLVVIIILLVFLLLREPGLADSRQVGSDFTGSNQHCKLGHRSFDYSIGIGALPGGGRTLLRENSRDQSYEVERRRGIRTQKYN